jgi:hypothetical protein
MLYWHIRENDNDDGSLPFVCSWCGSILTDADPASPCCSVECSRDWQAWRDRRVQPPEPQTGDVDSAF